MRLASGQMHPVSRTHRLSPLRGLHLHPAFQTLHRNLPRHAVLAQCFALAQHDAHDLQLPGLDQRMGARIGKGRTQRGK